jgi:hypothetical protein
LFLLCERIGKTTAFDAIIPAKYTQFIDYRCDFDALASFSATNFISMAEFVSLKKYLFHEKNTQHIQSYLKNHFNSKYLLFNYLPKTVLLFMKNFK